MQIGIDARLYGTKHGGIGRYTKELIANIVEQDHDNEYVFFVLNVEDKQELQKDLAQIYSNRTNLSVMITPYRWYSLKEQLYMKGDIVRAKVDLMHFPHFNVPVTYNKPYVVTIHDLIIHHFPDERATTLPKPLYTIKLWGYKRVMHHAVHKAKKIITPTEFGKRDLLKFYKIDENKIQVTYEGVSDLPDPSSAKPISTKYLLYVGSFYPHKNIKKLIDAFSIIKQSHDLKLILAGKKDYFQNNVEKYLHDSYPSLIPEVIFFGPATDEELAVLYKNASAFIFPSLYEGFGLPPLEALQFGTPVAASNASCIPEVLSDAATYFDPQDVEDMVAKINITITVPLTHRPPQHYSWYTMAEKTLQIYTSV